MKFRLLVGAFVLIGGALILASCGASTEVTATPTSEFADWISYELEDVQTGETFSMDDFAGKVVLIETMAIWCPNCIVQGGEVSKLHELLDYDEDFISISLDVDVNEDAAALKEYTEEFGFDWRFAVSPTPVNRALGNLYSAQYLNPPLNPMLLIDREGLVYELPYGKKDASQLLEMVDPFLNP